MSIHLVNFYKKALEINHDNFNAWFRLAETYLELGQWLEALKAYDECLRLKPDFAGIYYSKAKIYFLLSHTQQAIESLKKAFELDPNIKNEFTKDYPDVKSSKLFVRLLEENKS